MTPDVIRSELENAEGLPTAALTAAVAQAACLAPAVIAVLDKAASGIYLLPRQQNLLFFGLHALAAARETSACPAFMALLRRPEHELDRLLGDALGPGLLLGLYDGNVDPLYAALDDRGTDGQADLMNREHITSLFEEIKKTTRAIDVLVNNAGDARPGEINDDRVWEYEYKNIFLSAIHMSQQFLSMPPSQLRKIINITSLYGNLHTGNPQYLQYSAFKAALANVTTVLSKSTAPKVIVNAVAPGYTETPAWAGASKESIEVHARATSIGRFVTPEEVAHAVVFVAENDALVGQVLTLDGGTSLKGMP